VDNEFKAYNFETYKLSKVLEGNHIVGLAAGTANTYEGVVHNINQGYYGPGKFLIQKIVTSVVGVEYKK
jgi:hypothetical protein